MLIWACAGIGCGCAKAEDLEQSTLGPYLAALKEASETEISCKYKALLTDAERSDMQGLTRGLLRDAVCSVNVRISHSLVAPG